MRTYFLSMFLLIASGIAAQSPSGQALSDMVFGSENLRYKVMFKWGLITKQAGTAELSLRRQGEVYHSMLTASSAPWADRIFRVRDTLIGRMDVQGLVPRYYEKVANEGDERKHDIVRYDYSVPGLVRADCERRVFKNNRLHINEERQMESEGSAVDMLTSFYYMRSLPFETWQRGERRSIDIFSGKRKETLTLHYTGVEPVQANGTTYQAHHVKFTFTSGSGTKTSDDMDAWISADGDRIPLRMEGKLPVGKVHCILVSQQRQ